MPVFSQGLEAADLREAPAFLDDLA